MRAVLRVKIVQIGLVLEVIGVHLSGLHYIVRNDVVVKLLDLQGNAALREDLLGHFQDLRMRGGGGGDGDRLTGERIVIDGVVKTVCRILHHAHDGALVLFVDKVRNLLALQRGLERPGLIRVLVALLYGQHIAVGGGGALNSQRIRQRVQAGVDRKVGIDDGVVHILQDVGDLCSLNLLEGDVVRILPPRLQA